MLAPAVACLFFELFVAKLSGLVAGVAILCRVGDTNQNGLVWLVEVLGRYLGSDLRPSPIKGRLNCIPRRCREFTYKIRDMERHGLN